MAKVEHTSDARVLVPVGVASQIMAGSNQPHGDSRQSSTGQWIVSEPQRFSASS